MYITKQFSIFMVNKPGALSQVLGEFAKAKINIVAMTMMDSAEHGVMRVIFTSPERTKGILDGLSMPYSETDVLCLNLTNQSGALADVVEKLAKHHINISYAYCTAGARGGRTTGVIKVADVKKAIKVLEGGQSPAKMNKKKEKAMRRPRNAK
ncbi:MAG: ACT domain-containing protein [Phycisphaerae bacterium]|nr:ACT domain-containing protein [Phycisphaerae bacterium]